jgi:hypothetical protein
VPFGFYIVPDAFYLSVGADQKSAAHDAQERFAQKLLHAARAKSFDHFEIRIAEQGKIELLLLLEGRLSFDGIAARSQNGHALFVKLLLGVAKLGRFRGSTGSIGLGKNEKDEALAAVIAQRDVSAVISFQREIQSLVAWLKHKSPR